MFAQPPPPRTTLDRTLEFWDAASCAPAALAIRVSATRKLGKEKRGLREEGEEGSFLLRWGAIEFVFFFFVE